MVLESFITPFKAEQNPWRLLLFGFIYATVGVFLGLWVFKAYASLVMVFLATMAAIPLIYNLIIMEEEKDLSGMEERWLLKEHGKALKAFVWLFVGMSLAFAIWYTLLSSESVSFLFDSQTKTIQEINARAVDIEHAISDERITGVTGFASARFGILTKIFFNNVKVLIFCILFSFLFGSGAIFILTWNASVIGTAIGNWTRTQIAVISATEGLTKVAGYFKTISLGLFMYAIHGIPEILAYFTAGLAGGIISIAVIRHDFGTRKFEHIVLDAADLILLSLGVLVVAALLEVYVTPFVF
jgi:uncharacterized membrane protein SpoIIM required for sporulation